MKKHLLFLLFAQSILIFAQENPSLNDFQELCDNVGLTYEMPEGYSVKPMLK